MNVKGIHEYMLERYVLGELSPEEMKRVDDLIREDPETGRLVREIRKSSEGVLRRYPPEQVGPAIRARATRSPGKPEGKSAFRRHYLIPSLAAAAAVIVTAAFLLLEVGQDTERSRFRQDVIRIKGPDTQLFIYRKRNDGAELLRNNGLVREKDLLQIACFSTVDSYGVILSIDGRGTVTLHYPGSLSGDTRIDYNHKMLLSRAYELDDAPGFERFIFVTSRKPIDVRAARRAAETLAKNPAAAKKEQLQLDFPSRQIAILFRKE